jgi:DNA-binding transcriptional LysR family regulator
VRSGSVDDGAGLMTRTIGLQRMTVCASPAYIEAHGRPLTLDDLPRHVAITYGRAGRVRSWRFPLDAGIHDVMPTSRLRFDDLEAISEAAEAGYGLAWLPCWLIRDRVRAGTIVPLLADVPRLVFPLRALWLQTPHLPLRIRLAIDSLAGDLPGSAEL